MCHINMLKPYVGRQERGDIVAEMLMNEVSIEKESDEVCVEFPHSNSEIMKNLPEYLKHLDDREQQHLIDTIIEFKDLFKDVPGCTHIIEHDVDVGDTDPSSETRSL